MNNNPIVLSSIGFTVCGTIFLFLFSRIYFSGRKFYEFPAILFRTLIFICYASCISEIIFILMMADKGTLTTVSQIIARIHIFACILFITTISLYLISICKTERLEQNPKLKLGLTILYFMFAIGIFIISIQYEVTPYGGSADDIIYSINGPALSPIYMAGILLVFTLLYLFVTDYKSMTKKNKMCLIMIAIETLMIILIQQIKYYDFNDLSFLLILVLASIYFTTESQDGKLIKELQISKQEAERANKAQTEFLTSISHEIRTPMNNILGFSESLTRSKRITRNMVNRDVKAINDEGKALLELINNILDISRLESGKEKIENKAYELSDVVFEVNSNITHKINKEEIDYRVFLNEQLPSELKGDYKKICKIIILLLNNVIKQTPYGEIEISYNGDKTPDGSFIFNIEITCTGSNMTKEMFDIDITDFMSLGNSAGNTLDSEALGVIIAKKYIRLLGGVIEFKITSDENTKYSIKISQEIENDAKVGNIFNDVNRERVEKIDLSDKKILVVDDNRINLKLATKLLNEYNAEVETALSGKDCITLTNKKQYDLIFLDHMMPGMDGIATIKELKKNNQTLPPIIALTANTASGIREEYISYGFTDYLSKPINQRELNRLILDLFHK